MSNIAAHIRIFEASPTDDFVTKRVAVISALTDSFKKRSSYADLAGLANDIAAIFSPRAKLSDALTDQVAEAVSKESAAFDKDERTEEIAVLAALGALSWLAGVGKSADSPAEPTFSDWLSGRRFLSRSRSPMRNWKNCGKT